MKIVFIINNKNNRLARVLPGIQKAIQQAGLEEVQFHSTLRKKHAIELARQAVVNSCAFLIAIGGDGTLNEVINGVFKSTLPTEEYPTIGILPYGSANDFARTAHISNSIEELIALIQSNTTQEIDLGKITLQNPKKTRYFINIAGIGLGADVVRNIAQTTSVFGPGFNYFKHIIKGFLSYNKKVVSCNSYTWQWEGKLLQMAVANGRYFGKAICIAPDAKLNDGQFQVSIFGDLSVWDYLKNLSKLKKGVKIRHPEVQYQHTSEVFIDSNDACGIEADGEYVGLAPASIRVLSKAIRFLMPQGVQ